MSEEKSSAWRDGYSARSSEATRYNNPFRLINQPYSFNQWDTGWYTRDTEIEGQKSSSPWLPIEQAQEHKQYFLAKFENYSTTWVGLGYIGSGGHWIVDGRLTDTKNNPTHFMKIPENPFRAP
jgi:hypothetical protein